jgi:hypothetical protein
MLPHLAYLTGFPDPVLVVLTIGAINLLLRPSAVGILLGVTPLVMASLFIHEGYIIQLYPGIAVIGARVAIAHPRLRLSMAIHLLATLACLAFLVAFGRLDADGGTYLSYAQSRTDLALAPDAFIPITFDLHQQWHYCLARMSPATIAGFVVTMVTSLPYFLLLGWIHFRIARHLEIPFRQARWELAAFAMPFGLMVVGHDWMRWVSFASMNVTLVIGYRYLRHGDVLRVHLGQLVTTAWFQIGLLWTLVISRLPGKTGRGLRACG